MRRVHRPVIANAGISTGYRGPVPVLDAMGLTAAFAYSMRLLRASYYGSPVAQVFKAGDATGIPIVSNQDGTPNLSAVSAYAAGGTAVLLLFNQENLAGTPLSNSTLLNRASVAVSGSLVALNTGRYGFKFDGSSQSMVAAPSAQAQPFTRCSVWKFDSVAAGDLISDSSQNSLNFSSSGVLNMYSGSANPSFKSGIAAGDTAVVIETYSGASSSGTYNGTSTTVSPGTLGPNSLTLPVGNSRTCGECIVFASAISAGNRTAYQANAKAYWGTP